MSSNTSIHALKSLLIPNGQDTRCFFRRVNETVGQGNSAKTSAFCPQVWDPERLPLEAHLCGDLQMLLREQCARRALQSNYEGGAKALSECLSKLVFDIYYALTGRELMYQTEQPTSFSQVISDFTYEVDDRVHILGEAKSPNVFDHFIGELMGQMRDGSPVQL